MRQHDALDRTTPCHSAKPEDLRPRAKQTTPFKAQERRSTSPTTTAAFSPNTQPTARSDGTAHLVQYVRTHETKICIPSNVPCNYEVYLNIYIYPAEVVYTSYLEAVVLQQSQAPDGGLYIVAAADLLQDSVVRVLHPDLLQNKQRSNNITSPSVNPIVTKFGACVGGNAKILK